MRTLERWRRLAEGDRRLLMEALAAVASARLALWLRPFATVWRDLKARQPGSRPAGAAGDGEPSAIALAVTRASRWIPGATCLPQALAAYTMLARRGVESEVRFGVAREESRGFEAHAWVELHGDVLIGKVPDLHRYQPLPRPSGRGL